MSSENAVSQFERERKERIASNANHPIAQSAADFMRDSTPAKYSYNFSWLGRPIIQYPQDIVGMQELIWNLQPELIIETGIAHGGSLIFSASMLELVALCGGPSDSSVLGIDIDIRPHNRAAIESHPMNRRIQMIEGSSVDPALVAQVREIASGKSRVLVCLDSNHTHDHVLEELRAYAPMTSVGSYCVVFDTIVEKMTPEMFPDRDWKPGNSPLSAVYEYLKETDNFEIDQTIDNKLLISVAPEGYLKRIK